MAAEDSPVARGLLGGSPRGGSSGAPRGLLGSDQGEVQGLLYDQRVARTTDSALQCRHSDAGSAFRLRPDSVRCSAGR
jgi:hypothetical protein